MDNYSITMNTSDQLQFIYDRYPDLEICKPVSYSNQSMCYEAFVDKYGYQMFKKCWQYLTLAITIPDYPAYEVYTSISTAKFVIYGILLNLVCIFGIAGNILSLIVLKCREFKRSTTTLYLQGLLCIDCLYLLTNLIHYGFIEGLDIGKWAISSLPYYSKAYLAYCVIDALRNSSILLTMAVTSDRYIYVCHSFRAAELCTEKRSKISVIILLLVIVIYEIPRFFVNMVEEYSQRPPGCKPTYYQSPRWSGPDEHYITKIINSVGLILFLVIPLITIIILTSLLLRAIRQSINFRESMQQNYNQTSRNDAQTTKPNKSDERSTTIILLSVVISFIICSLPNTVIVIILEYGGNYMTEQSVKYLAPAVSQQLAILLLNINSASNFILFCFFGRKFRGVFTEIFFHCRWSHRSRKAFTLMNQSMQTQISSLNLSGKGLGSRSSTLSRTDYAKLDTRYGATAGRKPTPFTKQENVISSSFDGDTTPIFQSMDSIDRNGSYTNNTNHHESEASQSLLKSRISDMSDTAC